MSRDCHVESIKLISDDENHDDNMLASVPGLPRYAFTLRFNFAGEGTF